MSYAILRIQKLKGSIGGLGKHIDRSSNGNISIPENAGQETVNNNIHWDKNGNSYTQKEWAKFSKENPLSKRISDEINQRYTGLTKIRKDAVRAVEYIMTSDTIKMNEIFNDEKLYKSWMNDNKEFLKETFGEENIVSMHLHLDETTPHIHAVVVPITGEGRLSCKSFIDGKKDLAEQQTNYALKMEKYGMIRGVSGSNTKHIKMNRATNKNQSNYDYNRNR